MKAKNYETLSSNRSCISVFAFHQFKDSCDKDTGRYAPFSNKIVCFVMYPEGTEYVFFNFSLQIFLLIGETFQLLFFCFFFQYIKTLILFIIQVALCILLELAVQKGVLSAVLQAVLLLLNLWDNSHHDYDNRLSSSLLAAPLIPLLKRFESIHNPKSKIPRDLRTEEVIYYYYERLH